MNKLEYHEDIDSYINAILGYQIIAKPFIDKLTWRNEIERAKIVALILLFGLTTLIYKITKIIKHNENK